MNRILYLVVEPVCNVMLKIFFEHRCIVRSEREPDRQRETYRQTERNIQADKEKYTDRQRINSERCQKYIHKGK